MTVRELNQRDNLMSLHGGMRSRLAQGFALMAISDRGVLVLNSDRSRSNQTEIGGAFPVWSCILTDSQLF